MIYDGIGAIGRYRGLYKGLDILIDWLAQNDYKALPTGRAEILGNKVYGNVMDAKTRTYEDARYEVHHKYMDLQVDVSGVENFRVTPGATRELAPFDEATDKGYCHLAPGNADELEGTLANDHFAIFVVDEPHMPNLVANGAEVGPIRKICFKILADEFWDE